MLGLTGVGREEARQVPSRRAEEGEAAGSNPEHRAQIPNAPGSLPIVGPKPAEGALAHKVQVLPPCALWLPH